MFTTRQTTPQFFCKMIENNINKITSFVYIFKGIFKTDLLLKDKQISCNGDEGKKK